LLINLEYRTLPWEFHTLHAGLVVFYDAGSAFSDAASLKNNFTHTIGIGLRTLFPQFDTQTFRFDFGYVIRGPPASSFADQFSTSFGQVFDYRPAFLDQPL
jgi:outer membrane translocation and assembly module TamA